MRSSIDINNMVNDYDNSNDIPLIELVDVYNPDKINEEIEKEEVGEKPDHYDFLTSTKFTNTDIQNYDYNNSRSEVSRYNKNQLNQLKNFIETNNVDIILGEDLKNFLSNNRHYSNHFGSSSDMMLYGLSLSEYVKIKMNDRIVDDIATFNKSHIKTNDTTYFTLNYNSHDYVFTEKVYTKNKYRKKLRKKLIDEKNFRNRSYMVLYSLFKNVEKLKQNQSARYYDYQVTGDHENYIVLYPIKKFGIFFWIIVSDSSKLINVKSFNEYVEEEISKNMKQKYGVTTPYEPISNLGGSHSDLF